MKPMFRDICFILTIACSSISPMLGCASASKEVSPEEAKAMVLRFLSEPQTARLGSWVTASRKLVEEDRPSRLPSGDIVIGPWVIDPKTRRVQLAIDRAQLDASFSKDGEVYVIKAVEVIEIRRKR